MKPIRLLVAAALLVSAPALAQEVLKAPARKTIDLAICLDTSGSMRGLIDSARMKIWAIVNDLALAKPTPRLRVALLSYGNDGHDPAAGWVKVETDLTEDLDLVSQRLFAYTTHGGTELVGRVIRASLTKLSWTKDPGALKLIVVAGNESADQDKEFPFREQCKASIARGIMINSIYCTRNEDNVVGGWRDIARLSDGHFAQIDQNRGTVTVATPFDAQLTELSTALNLTYVPFGKEGKRGWLNQKAQDLNAKKLASGVAALRAQTKGGALYNCDWCLVDATRNKQVKLEEVKAEDLPEVMRVMTLVQRQEYLDSMFDKRTNIQAEIKVLSTKRLEHLTAEMAKSAEKDDKSFDAAVRRAIRAQAAKKGYEFEK